VLFGACAAGIVYLNYLNVNVAKDLSENVQSTQVAARLEATTLKLVGLLRDTRVNSGDISRQVDDLNVEAQAALNDAEALANLENEQILVGVIRRNFNDYMGRWSGRGRLLAGAAGLGDLLERTVLEPCRELRHYNTDQVEQSDRENRAIVQKLRWGLLAVGLGLPLGGLVLGYAVARSLRHSIHQLSVGIRDAAGRLSRDLGSVTLEEEGVFPDLHKQMKGVTAEIERVIGQLQQREREVLRAEQLAAVGQVAAGVAHELRNPLTSVKMLVQTGLEGKPPAGLPHEDLAIIEHEIRRMEQCIRVFLDFAKPPDSERRPTDIGDVVRRAMALVEGRARRQQVRLAAEIPPRPVEILIDSEQVHQVLVNLLLNALDALPHGGDVGVTVTCAAGTSMPWPGKPMGRAVAVQVRDNGPGIAPRIRERLFEPFVSSKETGLGLGLSICKRLVEAHGGGIGGANLREGGAEFTFTLPFDNRSPATAAVVR
jgi:signal transduction histidine kinase